MSLYAAFCLLMAAYGVTRVTGLEVKWGLTPADEVEPIGPGDWIVLGIFCVLALAMFGCAFLPAAPWSWGVGLAALIVGLSCCGAPSIVLLVLWCQMPTRLYFATHGWRNLPQPMSPPPVPPPY
ncbi:hypothetical protein [Roseimicrobium gellanilyticum]|uniref:hypothetical protein n=1 Tax=Roseimicrobium gellanilyticum TaxID=748857 RepID=UPI0011BE9911|nr:hypothetical protein [Roseimicrobium gellanilyticum]